MVQFCKTFIDGLDVSRETTDMLRDFVDLIIAWSGKINLISASTIPTIWERHILDSIQLLPVSDSRARHWCDLGSGGGMPGLVMAIVGKEYRPLTSFTLIESDARKAAFLKHVIQRQNLNAQVIAKRIENAEPQNANIISARALAPLDRLLAYVFRHGAEDSEAILLKGQHYLRELEAASRLWQFSTDLFQSSTDENSRILKIRELKPKDRPT
jgi:16S rRNA (guanine527-N7)-methyltransferase